MSEKQVPAGPLTVLQRLIEQLPGGDQVLQRVLQPGAIDPAAPAGTWGRADPLGDAVRVMFEEAEIDAVVGALLFLFLGVGGEYCRLLADRVGKAQPEDTL